MARTRHRRGQGERLRDELLDAAEALLTETGDEHAVTVRAVVDRVGVTPPSLYRHFATKGELVAEAVGRRFEALGAAIAAGAEAGGRRGGSAEALRGGCLGYLRWAAADPRGYALLFTTRRSTLVGGGRPRGTQAFDALVGGIAAAQAAGQARAGEPERLALLVWAALHGIATLAAARPHIAWPPQEELLDDLLAGLLELPRSDAGDVAD